MPQPKLDPEFKAKWLKALRSGHYKQTNEVLRRKPTNIEGGSFLPEYCCLGVACNIVNPKKWHRDVDNFYEAFGWGVFSSTDVGELAPVIPFVEAGETDHRYLDSGAWDAGMRSAHSAISKLAYLNDTGFSFKQIADWIEENL